MLRSVHPAEIWRGWLAHSRDVRGSTTLAEGMSDGGFSALFNRFDAM